MNSHKSGFIIANVDDKQDSIPSTNSPEIVVMGKDVSTNNSRCNSGSAVWGVLIIYAGCILLLNSLGFVSWEIWETLFRYWPTLLILGGLHVLLGNSFVSRCILLIAAIVVFGTIVLLPLIQMYPYIATLFPQEVVAFVLTVQNFVPNL